MKKFHPTVSLFLFLVIATLFSAPVMAADKVVLSYMEYPPYSVLKDGAPDGPWGKIFVEIFKKLNVEFKVEQVPWARVLENLKDGSGCVTINMAKTAEREEFTAYPEEPIAMLPFKLFVKKDSTLKFESLDNLKPIRVGVRKAFVYQGEFGKADYLKKDESPDDETLLNKLLSDRVDAVVLTEMGGWQAAKKLGVDGQIKMLDKLVAANPQYTGFSKKNPCSALVTKYTEVLKAMKADGSYDKILQAYK